MACPSSEELLAFHLGELTDAQIAHVGEHLSSCPNCERHALSFDGLSDTALAALRRTDATAWRREAYPAISTPVGPAPSIPEYEIIHLVGRGGMGQVWKARHKRLDRLVALKTLTTQGAAVRERFQAEAQAVARMSHPNIVQIFEVGECQDQPFLTLEFLDGGTLADRLNGKPQNAGAGAALVQTLARAVHYAHTQGIVHRDLKPVNILLDTQNVPKIADFGIAKHLQATGQTRDGDIVGTAQYMAPEQANGDADIGPAADLYSLGVILYEMLTGRVPLRGTSDLATVLMVQREEPVPPRHLQPGLSRDLETICMKCLRKDPRQRYASAADLADDLGRLLNGEPIRARPTPRWERAGKWARRQPTAAALVLAVAFIVFGGFPGVTVLWIQADQARGEEASQRKKAEDATKAETAAKNVAEASEREAKAMLAFFNMQIFSAMRDVRNGGLGPNATLRQAIDRSMPMVEVYFAGQPLVEARMRHTLGLSYRTLGEAKKAVEQFEKSHQLFVAHLGLAHPDSHSSMVNLGQSYAAVDRRDEARALFETLLPLQIANLGADDDKVQQTKTYLADVYQNLGRHDDAIRVREEVLVRDRTKHGLKHADTQQTIRKLVSSYRSAARYADETKVHEEMLAAYRAENGLEHHETMNQTNYLLMAYRNSGHSDGAVKTCLEIFTHYREKYGPENTQTLRWINELAQTYFELGRHAEAEKIYQELLTQNRKTKGPGAVVVQLYMKSLADCYAAQSKHEDALELREERLALVTGPGLQDFARMGDAYRELGRHAEALQYFNKVVDGMRARPGQERFSLPYVDRCAEMHTALGQHDEALKLDQATLQARRADPKEYEGNTLKSIERVAFDLVKLQRGAEALPMIDDCVKRIQGKTFDKALIPNLLVIRLEHFRKRRDSAGCRETAEIWENLKRNGADYYCFSARLRAATAAVIRETDQSPAAAKRADEEADRAIGWLKQAVANGLGLGQMNCSEFAVLQRRDDFTALVAELNLRAQKTKH